MTTPSVDRPPILLARFDQAATLGAITKHTSGQARADPTMAAASAGELRGIPAIGRGARAA